MTKTLNADSSGCVIHEGNWDSTLFTNPMSDPSKIFFHSDFGYYGVATLDLSVSVSHPALAGATVVTPGDITVYGATSTATHVLITHGLGYTPKFFVSYNGGMLPQGVPIQTQSGGRARFVTAYATTTQILLWERAFSTASALSAASRNYSVVVFRDIVSDPALPMLELSPTEIIFGQGKFRLSDPHMRLSTVGDTDYAIALGRTADIKGGGLRVVPPSGSSTDLGTYTGSFTGSSVLDLTI